MKTAWFMLCVVVFCAQQTFAEPSQQLQDTSKTITPAFTPGEKLTYSISWSKVITAGTAVMEVKEGQTTDNKPVLRFVISVKSVGIVEAFYPVRETVESTVDPDGLYSLSFKLQESQGKKKRRREMIFDHKNKTVIASLNDDRPETFSVADRVQDALSALYYIRTSQSFDTAKPIVVNVFDSGKTWAVEVYTLGKEKIKTPAGEFNTIKVKTYPKYEGVFMNKGEIFIWLTDDARKIPVLMKSIITIGSIVTTLTDIQGIKADHDLKDRTQASQ